MTSVNILIIINVFMLEKCTRCFQSLSVSSRLRIYQILDKPKPISVSQIVRELSISQPTVSYHLQVMKQTGLLESVKVGKEVYYSINKACPVDHGTCLIYQIEHGNLENK